MARSGSFFGGGHTTYRTAGEVFALVAVKAGSYLVPWFLSALAGVGTELAHLAWGSDPTSTPFVALAFAGAGAALTILAYRLTEPAGNASRRLRIRHQLYTAVTAAVAAGATVGLVVGVTGAVLKGWVILGAALSLAVNVRNLVGQSNANEPDEAGEGGKWGRLAKELKLERYALESAAGNGRGVVTAQIQAKDGATVDELQRRLPAMASALHVGQGRMTASANPEDVSDITLRVTAADVLKAGVPWSGPSALGYSIADWPIPAGRYENGEDVRLQILTDKPITHLLAAGTSGAGKSESIRTVIADLLTRRDVTVWAVDCSKGMQTLGCIRHGIDWLITDEEKARQFFKLLPAVIRARTNRLPRGMWTLGCGLNFLVILLEEAADFAADSAEYDRLLRTARSAGVWIVTSLQRATHTNISTNARALHGSSTCFGVTDASDAAFVLPSSVVEAGAVPEWGANKPGYAYLAGMGAPEELWPMVMRWVHADPRRLADAVTAAEPYRQPCDLVTAAAAGSAYAARTVYTTPAALDDGEGEAPERPAPAPSSPLPAPRPAGTVIAPPAPPPAGPPDEEILDMDAEQVAREVAELTEMLGQVAGANPEPDAPYAGVGLDDPIPEPDPDEPALPIGRDDSAPDRISTEEGRAQLHRQLDAWVREGRTEFKPADLSHIWLRVRGDGRRWFYRERDELLAARAIGEMPEKFGYYALIRSPFDSRPGDAA